MTSTVMRSVYLLMAVITSATVVLSIWRDKGKNLFAYYQLCAWSTLGWQAVMIARYTVTSFEWLQFLDNAVLPFVALSALGTFLYVLRFYGMEKYYSAGVLPSLCVGPLITAALTLFFYKKNYLSVDFRVLEVKPLLITEFGYGPWFFLHTAYCYILILLAFCIAVAKHRGLPKTHRATSVVLLTGMFVCVLISFLSIANIFRSPFDLPLAGITFCGVFMYLAARQNHSLRHVHTARKGIFNSLGEAIFILDTEREIISRNNAADALIRLMNLPAATRSFSAVGAKIFPDKFFTGSGEEEDSGDDFLLAQEIFNLREKVITDRRGRTMGYFIAIKNVNQNRRMIRHLEENAGIDALTGICNRMYMDKMRSALDNKDNYPLGVICGDLNGLKEVNDTLGHQQGDVLLMAGAEALVSSCPPSACIGRMGGDEFLILLPGYSEQRVGELVSQIEERMRRADDYPYEVSMSLGSAVKTHAAQSLEEVIGIADSRMYEHKRLFKLSRNQRPPRMDVPASSD